MHSTSHHALTSHVSYISNAKKFHWSLSMSDSLFNLMPSCPKCLKYFPTVKAVSQHIQQPQSACNKYEWTSGLIGAACELVDPAASHSLSPGPVADDLDVATLDSDFYQELQDDLDRSTDDIQYDFEPQRHVSSLDIVPPGQAVDLFNGTAVIYRASQTFLMHFDLDQYSICHSQNLYYPFANLDNWQMANFFLISQLSMQEINKYLFLNMVSHL